MMQNRVNFDIDDVTASEKETNFDESLLHKRAYAIELHPMSKYASEQRNQSNGWSWYKEDRWSDDSSIMTEADRWGDDNTTMGSSLEMSSINNREPNNLSLEDNFTTLDDPSNNKDSDIRKIIMNQQRLHALNDHEKATVQLSSLAMQKGLNLFSDGTKLKNDALDTYIEIEDQKLSKLNNHFENKLENLRQQMEDKLSHFIDKEKSIREKRVQLEINKIVRNNENKNLSALDRKDYTEFAETFARQPYADDSSYTALSRARQQTQRLADRLGQAAALAEKQCKSSMGSTDINDGYTWARLSKGVAAVAEHNVYAKCGCSVVSNPLPAKCMCEQCRSPNIYADILENQARLFRLEAAKSAQIGLKNEADISIKRNNLQSRLTDTKNYLNVEIAKENPALIDLSDAIDDANWRTYIKNVNALKNGADNSARTDQVENQALIDLGNAIDEANRRTFIENVNILKNDVDHSDLATTETNLEKIKTSKKNVLDVNVSANTELKLEKIKKLVERADKIIHRHYPVFQQTDKFNTPIEYSIPPSLLQQSDESKTSIEYSIPPIFHLSDDLSKYDSSKVKEALLTINRL